MGVPSAGAHAVDRLPHRPGLSALLQQCVGGGAAPGTAGGGLTCLCVATAAVGLFVNASGRQAAARPELRWSARPLAFGGDSVVRGGRARRRDADGGRGGGGRGQACGTGAWWCSRPSTPTYCPCRTAQSSRRSRWRAPRWPTRAPRLRVSATAGAQWSCWTMSARAPRRLLRPSTTTSPSPFRTERAAFPHRHSAHARQDVGCSLVRLPRAPAEPAAASVRSVSVTTSTTADASESIDPAAAAGDDGSAAAEGDGGDLKTNTNSNSDDDDVVVENPLDRLSTW
jgi:hypothetical protein